MKFLYFTIKARALVPMKTHKTKNRVARPSRPCQYPTNKDIPVHPKVLQCHPKMTEPQPNFEAKVADEFNKMMEGMTK